MSNPAEKAWRLLLADIMLGGKEARPRGLLSKELLGKKSVVDMKQCVINLPARKLGYRFMCAEAAWIMSGDNRVSSISPFSSSIASFSDDGIRFFGAYGPRVIDQLSYVLKALIEDPDTRQAVMTIWRPNPPKSKDIPCTVSVQWMIREGRLDCFMNMRSSDAWLGVPYDWFNFSMLSLGILAELNRSGRCNYDLGCLHFYAASQHIYEPEFHKVRQVLDEADKPGGKIPYKPLNTDEFATYQEVVDYLWAIARKWVPEKKVEWLGEFDATRS